MGGMTGSIFISYRRNDSQHAAGRLVDRLGRLFDCPRLFMDVDVIEPARIRSSAQPTPPATARGAWGLAPRQIGSADLTSLGR
jgi:hypothetical protein